MEELAAIIFRVKEPHNLTALMWCKINLYFLGIGDITSLGVTGLVAEF